MISFKKTIVPIISATLWIVTSEFIRNNILLHHYWIQHYKKLNIIFPEKPINGVIWTIWSLFFAIIMYIFSKKYTFLQTSLLSWLIGFVIMWLVIGNLGVLPYTILIFTIPLSLLESFFGCYLIFKLTHQALK